MRGFWEDLVLPARNRETRIPIAAERAAAVRCALERIIASEVLRNAPQLARFLSFVIEETLEGRAAELKGYTIATQALGRSADFDPQIDPIVRVEAMRLRRALETYYAGPGAGDPVTIDIPRGSYVPNFMIDTAKAARAGDNCAPVDESRTRSFIATAIVVCLLAAVFLAARFSPDVSRPRPEVTVRLAELPTVIIEPMIVEGDVPQGFSDRRFRLVLSDALARFDEIGVVDRRSVGIVPQPSGGNGVYSLSVIASAAEADLEVAVQLVRQPDGLIVWSRRFSEADREPGNDAPDLPSRIAAIVAQPSGVMFADLRERDDVSSPVACMLKVFAYWGRPSEALHAETRECVEHLAWARPGLATAHALLALIYLDEHRMAFNPRPDPIGRALDAAERAIALGPESARAHQALMAALFARGDRDAALEAGRRAVTLNPNDSNILAGFGATLILAGEYAAGAGMIRRARQAAPGIHARFDFYLFLANYMQGDAAAAARALSAVSTPGYPLGLLARSIAAAEAGDEAQAAEFLHALTAVEPDFLSNPAQAIERRGMSPDVVVRLVGGFERARALYFAP
jgi:Tfp pilus assembly protein PilF